MHAYIITRGIKHDVDRMITELQGKYLDIDHNHFIKGQPKQKNKVQLSIRPIQLWEVVFPEPQRDVVLNTLLGNAKGKTQHKKHNKYIWGIRKALGCDPIPEYKTDALLPSYQANTEIVGIGVKEDYYIDDMTGEKYVNATPEQKARSSEGI